MENIQQRLNEYIEQGWVRSQTHPTLDLTIYNYTHETQFEKRWDDITLMCRGLVLNSKGIIVARPFKKFFNWEEIVHTLTPERLEMPFELYSKMDGSLGIVFFYEGELLIATRGSFTSDQCIKAKEIMKKYKTHLLTDKIIEQITGGIPGDQLTLLFEIIFKSNRIVVDYGDMEELVLLGAIETVTDKEIDYAGLDAIGLVLGCPVVKKHDLNINGKSGFNLAFESLRDLNLNNEEGYIIKYLDNFRMKAKFPDYCALHSIITNCSSYDVWENLMKFDKLPEELLEKVPDEFYSWIKEMETKLRKNYRDLEYQMMSEFIDVFRNIPEWNRKEFALEAVKRKNNGILFAILNKKDYSDKIWKLIKPPYEKPFKDKE